MKTSQKRSSFPLRSLEHESSSLLSIHVLPKHSILLPSLLRRLYELQAGGIFLLDCTDWLSFHLLLLLIIISVGLICYQSSTTICPHRPYIARCSKLLPFLRTLQAGIFLDWPDWLSFHLLRPSEKWDGQRTTRNQKCPRGNFQSYFDKKKRFLSKETQIIIASVAEGARHHCRPGGKIF